MLASDSVECTSGVFMFSIWRATGTLPSRRGRFILDKAEVGADEPFIRGSRRVLHVMDVEEMPESIRRIEREFV